MRPRAPLPADRPLAVFSAVFLTAIVAAILMVAPVVVGALVNDLGFTPGQAGLTISLELGAMSLAALPALWWLPRWRWQRLLYPALLVMVVGNIACAFAHGFALLGSLRVLTGLAGGSVMVVCLAAVGMTRHTERNFGWWTIGQLLLGAVGLALLPRVLPVVGPRGLFIGLAVLLAAGLLFVAPMPAGANAMPEAAGAAAGVRRSVLRLPPLLGLAGILCLYVALGGVWTFVERIGAASGLAATSIGDDLTIASLCGIAGCGAAIVVGGRFGRMRPLLLGFALILGGTFGLFGTVSALRFLLATGAFKFAWTFALPYILAGMASHELSGRLMALANFMIGGGLALGPALVAALLGAPPHYGVAAALGLVAGGASLALLLLSLRRG